MIEPPRPHARQVDVDHVVPVVVVRLVQRVATVADTGVGHDDVEPAQLLHSAVDRFLQGGVVAHVDFGGHDAAVVALDQVGGFG